jgi:cell division transport system permease protein
MINGLIASVISIFLLIGVIYFVQYEFVITGLLAHSLSFIIVGFIVILSGVILAGMSSYLAVGKYLKMQSNDMFFI